MELIQATSFYRRMSDYSKPIEDAHFLNDIVGFWGALDGGSAAYSPQNPPLKYRGGFTGGQMASHVAATSGMDLSNHSVTIDRSLSWMNTKIRDVHYSNGLEPGTDDVGGTCFAVAKVAEEGLDVRIGGDCAIFWTDDDGSHFLNGFDEEAEKVEAADEAELVRLKEQFGGDLGATFDAYYPYYRQKRRTYHNKHIGHGGFALLNGDPMVENCWTKERILWKKRPDQALLMTDGCLPASMTAHAERPELLRTLRNIIDELSGNNNALFEWRDVVVEATPGEAPHIVGHPEATYIRLEFDIGK
jgi:hypothetical protein